MCVHTNIHIQDVQSTDREKNYHVNYKHKSRKYKHINYKHKKSLYRGTKYKSRQRKEKTCIEWKGKDAYCILIRTHAILKGKLHNENTMPKMALS